MPMLPLADQKSPIETRRLWHERLNVTAQVHAEASALNFLARTASCQGARKDSNFAYPSHLAFLASNGG